jgi:hypothetical protein
MMPDETTPIKPPKVQISVSIDVDDLAFVQRRASEEGIRRGEWLTRAIEERVVTERERMAEQKVA